MHRYVIAEGPRADMEVLRGLAPSSRTVLRG